MVCAHGAVTSTAADDQLRAAEGRRADTVPALAFPRLARCSAERPAQVLRRSKALAAGGSVYIARRPSLRPSALVSATTLREKRELHRLAARAPILP